ncbi:hypothetical protein K402DRAFT_403274 [Aulographum hederae CBS 113979]|uniref:GPI-anchored cell wall organization protein Ecm33 n=1 Tax=Aulographum hederae CBS 113979 TaxID=1176131 RepID=A0A6G1H4M7_9PEZI|nr:hypothetical protein K402DRAFT_403274 [Aulographum hederae CBS 113979]
MSLFKLVLPVLAAVGTAHAACSISATTTIQNAGDASAMATCSTFSGSIAIATGTTDAIAINNVQTITGDLVARNVTRMSSLSADSLQRIGGDFILDDVQVLGELSFPQLGSVRTIQWTALPNLQSISFTSGLRNSTSLLIDNTGLQSMDGLSVSGVDSFTVSNNGALQNVSLAAESVDGIIEVNANGDSAQVTFPNLVWAVNMTLRNVATVELPALEVVNGTLYIVESTTLQSINARNLTTTGGLDITDNSALANISMPSLRTVNGGFKIQDNEDLTGDLDFPSMRTVIGALDFYGNFSSVGLPELADVRGAFNIQSSGDIQDDCGRFDEVTGRNNVIKGPFACLSRTDNPQGEGTASGTSSGSQPSKTGAAGHLDVSSSAMMGFTGVIAAMLGLL